ncbi:hypothetical protein A31E_01842 [Escherichia sp. KTE159]|nr:hypothetical protein A31E_01842 [Escherichia sp. KTE159]
MIYEIQELSYIQKRDKDYKKNRYNNKVTLGG